MSRYVANPSWRATFPQFEKVREAVSKKVSDKFPVGGFYRVVYGYDHACFYFIQLENLDEEIEFDFQKFTDIDSRFDGMTGAELGFILEVVGDGNNALKERIDKCYLDMEI